VLCGPCALVRWLRALHLALTSPATRTLAGAIDRAAAVDGSSPHLCRSRRPLPAGIAKVPLLPPIDPRGYLSITPRPLSPHSVSHLARGNTTGRARCTASTRKPPTNRSNRRRPRRRSRHRPPPTRLATGNRPSHGAAPTRHTSAESTAPWTRRTAEQPTSTAESWRCSPTREEQLAILMNWRSCPGGRMAPMQQPPLSANINRYFSKCHLTIDLSSTCVVDRALVVDADQLKSLLLWQ